MTYEQAMSWLNVKFCLAQTKTEEEVIKHIQEILCHHNESHAEQT